MPDRSTLGAGASRSENLCLVAAVAACILCCAFIDVPLVRYLDPYERTQPEWLDACFDVVRQYGQGYFVMAVVAGLVLFDWKRKREIVLLVIAVLLAALAVHLLKTAAGRARPHEYLATGATWKALGGFRGNLYNSFPSAHTASAFAFSAALSVVYPRLRWLLFAAATVCGLSRLGDLQHWPSDIIAGAGLGAWLGFGAFRWAWSDRLADRLTSSRDPARGA